MVYNKKSLNISGVYISLERSWKELFKGFISISSRRLKWNVNGQNLLSNKIDGNNFDQIKLDRDNKEKKYCDDGGE